MGLLRADVIPFLRFLYSDLDDCMVTLFASLTNFLSPCQQSKLKVVLFVMMLP